MLIMIIDGKKIAEEIQESLKEEIKKLRGRPPCLAAIVVGSHKASMTYVKKKVESCQSVGIKSLRFDLKEETKEEELLSLIESLNQNKEVDGILLQLPLPSHLNPHIFMDKIDPKKDVDGFTPENIGRLLMGDPKGFIPCTPRGIQVLLEKSGIEVSGQNVVILGRSLIVGKPMASLMIQANATVTVLHSKSKEIVSHLKQADIIIAAIGKPLFLKKEMVKKGAAVIDVGINRIDTPNGYKIVGDADFDELVDICSAITKVPGGVGPMTIAMLLSNTFKANTLQHSL